MLLQERSSRYLLYLHQETLLIRQVISLPSKVNIGISLTGSVKNSKGQKQLPIVLGMEKRRKFSFAISGKRNLQTQIHILF